MTVPTEMLTDEERGGPATPPPAAPDDDELRAGARRRLARVRRLRLHVAAWALGTIVLTTLWVVDQWQENGAFERLGNEGNPGDWNPTLWALGVGVWGLAVGIMALGVHFERPPTEAKVDRELAKLSVNAASEPEAQDAELRRFARERLEQLRRLRFHVAAWMLGMLVLTPLWALIEWQDNGGFERFGDESRPGEWEPWILYVGSIWALVIAVYALRFYLDRPTTEVEVDREVRRLRAGG